MSKKISHENALEKYNHELESRELHKKGIHAKTSRAEKKRLNRESKTNQFMKMLKERGGLKVPKEEDV